MNDENEEFVTVETECGSIRDYADDLFTLLWNITRNSNVEASVRVAALNGLVALVSNGDV